jgi:two-component system, NarL family, response regulator DegU
MGNPHFLPSSTVLLADDNAELAPMVQRVLKPEYTLVESVRDGNALLERVLVVEPDVVLLDISMPGMDGFVCARRLKQLPLSTKIIFLTVHDDRELCQEAKVIGVHGYVLKSRLIPDLNEAIHEALENRCFFSPSKELQNEG